MEPDERLTIDALNTRLDHSKEHYRRLKAKLATAYRKIAQHDAERELWTIREQQILDELSMMQTRVEDADAAADRAHEQASTLSKALFALFPPRKNTEVTCPSCHRPVLVDETNRATLADIRSAALSAVALSGDRAIPDAPSPDSLCQTYIMGLCGHSPEELRLI